MRQYETKLEETTREKDAEIAAMNQARLRLDDLGSKEAERADLLTQQLEEIEQSRGIDAAERVRLAEGVREAHRLNAELRE